MPKVTFREERCKGCELCTSVCPKEIVKMSKHFNTMGFHPATVEEQEKCIGCTFCALICPDVVITIEKEDA
jgi:2-oxoglutarate ferredoxin oxidoreductase subunit delta